MRLKQICALLILITLSVCLNPTLVKAQSVAGRILDEVTYQEKNDKIAISVNFNFPVRYLSHFPDEAGRELRIQLQPISVAADDLSALSRREIYSPARANPGNIREIIYEGDSYSKLFLTVYFNSQTSFSVEQGNDYRSLLVLIDPPPVRGGNYAINLESSLAPINKSAIAKQDLFEGYSLYTTSTEIDGQIWHRLRLGFFPTKKAANEVLKGLQNVYPQAWVTKAPQTDINAAEQAVSEPQSAPPVAVEPPKPVSKPALKPLSEERKTNLLEEGRQAMLKEDYRRAVQIYTRLQQSDDPEISQQALEYLGLARERNNQLAHAKAEYEKYLTLYPTGEGAERVKQRLAGVLTARATAAQPLRATKDDEAGLWRTDIYGSFSQYYDRDESYTNNEDAVINRSSLTTDLDLNARFRSDDYDVRFNFVGGYEKDFRDSDDSEERISSLYLDVLSHKLELSTRIGRQSRSTGGVLGRFDGALVSWQAFEKIGVNLVAGYPVSFSREIEPDTDRPLYGISFDLGTFAEMWDFNIFYITQDVDSITDREAVGGEVRFFKPGLSFFTLVDYDIFYNKLNTVLFNSNWQMSSKTTVNLSGEYRHSPILTTSNALQGQTLTTIDQMLQSISEEQVKQLALDRTTIRRAFTLGVTHSFSPNFQVNADVTVSKQTGTPTSTVGIPPIVDVAGYDGTGYEYFYSLQFIGSSLIKEGDIGIIGLRYSDTSSYRTYSLNIDTRYPVTRNLRINPRFLVDYRTVNDSSNELLKFRPLVRLEYRWKRRYNFEIEGGLEISTEETSTTVDDQRGYFLTVGYRIDF